MRSHEEMMSLILNKAMDERILLVTQEGSRNTSSYDQFSDYDITYFTNDIESFDDDFVEDFGDLMILQKPEAMDCLKNAKTYLMMFQDGNRIDLKIAPLIDLQTYLQEENVTVLLDKKGLCDKKIYVNHTYEVQMLNHEEAYACLNEFYWIALYVLKGIMRNDLHYANYFFSHICMEECLKMMSFDIQLYHEEKIKMGKCYKRIYDYIPEEDRLLIKKWFHSANQKEMSEALLACMTLFETYAKDAYSFMKWDLPVEVSCVRQYVDLQLENLREI